MSDEPKETLTAWLVGEGAHAVFSLSGRERLIRTLGRLNIAVSDQATTSPNAEQILIINADFAWDERIIRDLAARQATVLTTETASGDTIVAAAICPPEAANEWASQIAARREAGGPLESTVSVLTIKQLSGAYNEQLRKREVPLAIEVTPEARPAIEKRLFMGAYKGATDLVTKYVFPRPALSATRLAAKLGLSPNSITMVSFILTLLAMFLFWEGAFLVGLLAAWGMCFLDTVDGKLARVTLQSSKIGNAFDHGIDLIHPPFWYAAWAFGVVATMGAVPGLWTALWVVNIGYVLGRLVEGYFLVRFKMEIHVWKPIDYFFRLITARRNPNLIMLSLAALIGAPVAGLFAVAVWTVLSILFHIIRILIAEAAVRSGTAEPQLQSWLIQGNR